MDKFDLLTTVLAATLLPIAAGTLAGFRFWRQRRAMMGNIVASAVVALIIVFLIARSFGLFFACGASVEGGCASQADLDFATKVMIGLAVLGWVDVFVLLVISGVVEDRAKRGRVRLDDF